MLTEKRHAGLKLLDLTISNPTQAFADYPHEDIANAFGAVSDFTYRPDPFGEGSARLAIANYYASRGIAISPEQVLLTASTSEAYAFLFKLLCNPGDEIVVPVPSYPLFDYLASLESIRAVPYRLRYDGSWFIDFASLSQSVSSKTRAILIVHPNNPTGSFVKREEADKLFAFANQHALPIISDEVFIDYSFGRHPERAQTLTQNNSILTFSLNGLSKSGGMPQVKLAWIAISGPAKDCETARTRLELIADTYLSVSTAVQRALPELLRIGSRIQGQIASRLTRNLDILRDSLQNSSAHILHVEGGWSAIIQLAGLRSEDAWIELFLNDCGVILQPGYLFDFESGAHVVASLLTPPETLSTAFQRISQLIDH